MNYSRFLQFGLTKGIGDRAISRLLSYVAENHTSIDDVCDDIVLRNNLLGGKSEIIASFESFQRTSEELNEKLTENNIKLTLLTDENYPQKLKQHLGEKCPPFLFYKGNLDILSFDSVGFCGSRKVSPKGLKIAMECSKILTEHNLAIVSGYASGTDLAAHRASLEANGNTVFVLAEGILRANIKSEVKDILTDTNHIFISQFMPTLTWNPSNAMKRNALIIGLSDAMVLIESSMSGGTFEAGRTTLQLHCPLFVVDYAQSDGDIVQRANAHFIDNGGVPIRQKGGVPNLSKILSVFEKRELFPRPDNSYGEQLVLDFT